MAMPPAFLAKAKAAKSKKAKKPAAKPAKKGMY